MGSAQAHSFPLTKNWRYVSPDLIRNQITHQLIQQSKLSFDHPENQHFNTQLLTKRIRLQHHNVLKLIYFSEGGSGCACGADGKAYRTVIYTQFAGNSLSQYLKINPLPNREHCPCVGVVQAALYLQTFYGFFQVLEDAVFLRVEGSGKEHYVKVWVHPSISESQPKKICSEIEMIDSLVRVLSFIQEKGFCKRLKSNQLELLQNAKKLKQVKRDILDFHQEEQSFQRRHKKTFSDHEVERRIEHKRKQTPIDEISENKDMRKIQSKPSERHQSTPHHNIQPAPYQENIVRKVEVRPIKVFYEQKVQKKNENPADKTFLSTQNTLNLQNYNNYQEPSSNSFKNKANIKNTIKFNYQSESSGKAKKVHLFEKTSIPVLQEQKIATIVHRPLSIPSPSTTKNENTFNIFEHQFGASTASQHGVTKISPFSEETQKRQSTIVEKAQQIVKEQNFVRRQMQIPIKSQQSAKDTPNMVPTTSRSPNKNKQIPNMAPISEVKQPKLFPFSNNNRNKRIASFGGPSNQQQKLQPFKHKDSGKFQRLEQYTKQIKEYEKNIRNWISNSMGTKKTKGLQVRPALQSDRSRPQQFKEVKSVYNDDSDKKNNQSSKEGYRLRTEEFDDLHPPTIRNKRTTTQYVDTEKQYNLQEEREEINMIQEELRRQYENLSNKQNYRAGKQEIDKYRDPEYLFEDDFSQGRQEYVMRGTQVKGEFNQQQQKYQQNSNQKAPSVGNALFYSDRQKMFEMQRARQLEQIVYQRQLQRHLQEEEEKDRQMRQKQQIQQDLQNQKRMISSQMAELLSAQEKEDEYNCIRQKVKLKKQTFAQLKAEALQLLADSQY